MNLIFYDSVSNVDYSDWCLPCVVPINRVSFNYLNFYDDSTDWGIFGDGSDYDHDSNNR
ncbi:MAG: hypothetical protein KGZ88_20910 [Methylomicrobium sp.]|nr:hypothetical protein [Methylomicrobium sp.]